MDPLPRRRSSVSEAALTQAQLEHELDESYQAEPFFLGWSLPAVFCAATVLLYHIPCYFVVAYVETQTDAIVIDGEGLPW
eukprot:CAMPEP_0181341708 /NCGR_PEP_ID=MMETSP1101-20121128/30573_1 /TAXON_ID=46948 /ORGANISM="Rhodomonas abbreviata, Strain Caron Lab Isolate" /LENGTH=79 /DNA_ID=CAMNT_0023453041 /DNA_START=120 /DNA_END=356 /DNA_ORIENTATION=-